MFVDREDAGQQLGDALLRFRSDHPCVLALSRGGVSVAFEVAKALEAPLDLVLVRKIGAATNPEATVAALVDGKSLEFVIDEELAREFPVSDDWLAQEKAKHLREIEQLRQAYLSGRPRIDVSGKTVILVDDGIGTGATAKAAIHAMRRAKPKRIILAVPVAPFGPIAALKKEADELVYLEAYEDSGLIDFYYENFRPVEDRTVRDRLALAARLPQVGTT